jgi:hypothetical protein
MKTALILAAVAAIGLSVTTSVRAEEADKKMELRGVLIDEACGSKEAKKDGATEKEIQAGAVKHPKACTLKCAKNGELALMSGGKMMKLDEKSTAKAMEYLGKDENGTRVIVQASKNEDGSLAISEIKAGGKQKDAAGKADGEKHGDHKH